MPQYDQFSHSHTSQVSVTFMLKLFKSQEYCESIHLWTNPFLLSKYWRISICINFWPLVADILNFDWNAVIQHGQMNLHAAASENLFGSLDFLKFNIFIFFLSYPTYLYLFFCFKRFLHKIAPIFSTGILPWMQIGVIHRCPQIWLQRGHPSEL